MDLKQLRQFLAVAETLSFSRAAERLFMAPSPLSRSIQQLEAELGGRLFVRDTRNVELTPLGRELVPYARRAVRYLDALKRDMRQHVTGQREIHIGMRSLPSTVLEHLRDLLCTTDPRSSPQFHPLRSDVQIERLLDDALSFGLVSQRVQDPRLRFLPVLQEAPALALPNRPPYADLDQVGPEDIRGLRLLLPMGTGTPSAAGDELEKYLRAARTVEWLEHEIVGGIETTIALNDACCFTNAHPDSPWHRYLAGPAVAIRPLAGNPPHSVTFLAWRADRGNAGDLGDLIEAISTAFPSPLRR
jgi:DNA-binding transcriptional LysR family regulator